MKKLNVFFLSILAIMLLSCSGEVTNALDNEENFKIEKSTFIENDEAGSIAKKFIKSRELLGPNTKSLDIQLEMVNYSVKTKSDNSAPAYYIYNINNNNGFIIVNAHKAGYPVLGYSLNSKFDSNNVSTGLAGMLDTYESEINHATKTGVKTDERSEAVRTEILNNEFKTKNGDPIEPLLGDIEWDQNPFYNAKCPRNTPVGCVATAVAQIIRFHEYPDASEGEFSYNLNRRRRLSFDYNREWSWEDMPKETLEENNEQVADLCFAIGVGLQMKYARGGSATSPARVPNLLTEYFKYDDTARIVHRRRIRGVGEWSNLIYAELEAGRPVLYSGSNREAGHAFVCDGYLNDGFFHINWGWSGNSNGYFLLNALNPRVLGAGNGGGRYNLNQNAVIGIQPPADAAAGL